MISVITCSIRDQCMKNVFRNFLSQNIKTKELIIILNNNSMKQTKWKELSNKYENIRVFQLSEKKTLGECLNVGIQKAKYRFIAKFDDDDYYGPGYLQDALETFKLTNADVVGKAAYYAYLRSKKALILLHENAENRLTDWVAGPTWVCKKEVFKKVHFSHVNIGEDNDFYKKCKKKGFIIRSNTKENFCLIRRVEVSSHSWKIQDEQLMKKGKIISYCKDFKPYVNSKK
ncbi:glycosyltransferase [Halalkalibacter lacteus]|uniref:glycosyltransferase n=1 Tax=Halalkalibacter lacteus TaxID=3090663 RepID=UPI002FC66CD7